jgi:hypothetical protein
LLFDALQYENNLELLLIGVCPETQLRGDEMGSDLPNPTPPSLVSPGLLLPRPVAVSDREKSLSATGK